MVSVPQHTMPQHIKQTHAVQHTETNIPAAAAPLAAVPRLPSGPYRVHLTVAEELLVGCI